MDIPGFGQQGQTKLRNTTALVSRIGGLGGTIALQLAAAGIGKLILAHGGNLQPSDLNRQILMRHGSLGQPRIESARETLQAFNPYITVETVNANINEDNAEELVGSADIVFDAAPRFDERFLMNQQCVRQRKALIDAAMFNMEGQVLTIVPGRTPCLACLYPEEPPHWNRRFPVLGAVSSLIANIAVVQGICLLTGIGDAHLGKMIYIDTAGMNLRKVAIQRRIDCAACQSVPSAAP